MIDSSLVEEIFDEASTLPEAEREVFLSRRCGGDLLIRRRVEQLLAHGSTEGDLIAQIVNQAARSIGPDPCHRWNGTRLGNYRLIREIGRGGMGTVYLAEREGEYSQRVAVKLVNRGMDSEPVLARFCYERQILARLAHTNIARLLDGGRTIDGLPYLVMEYIEGETIVEYCKNRNFSITERLRLFLPVCDAVTHAHRNLIVHRDLKPGNILVTPDGVPKLLDFGIAKLIDSETGIPCSTVPLMTPEYSSPEQVRGEPITTATDVYSAGAVLYTLLTGQHPHRLENHSLAEIERAVCRSEPLKPSRVSNDKLDGDLDAIVLKAMRLEPQDRYPSVDQLSADISRYLAGTPVLARQGAFAYRAAKFVRRHRTPVILSLMVFAIVLAALGAVGIQIKKRAEQVRRAERQFILLRKLTNNFVLDFHKKIQKLDRLDQATQLVLTTATEYIDGLANGVEQDPMFVRELARGYERIGDIFGSIHESSLNRPSEAILVYRKGVRLLEQQRKLQAIDRVGLRILCRTQGNLAVALETTGATAEAIEHYLAGLSACQQGASRTDPANNAELARAWYRIGDAKLRAGERSEAQTAYTAGLEIARTRTRLDAGRLRLLSQGERQMAEVFKLQNDVQSAKTVIEQAIQHAGDSAAKEPNDIQAHRERLLAYAAWVSFEAWCKERGHSPQQPARIGKAATLAQAFRVAFPDSERGKRESREVERLLARFPALALSSANQLKRHLE